MQCPHWYERTMLLLSKAEVSEKQGIRNSWAPTVSHWHSTVNPVSNPNLGLLNDTLCNHPSALPCLYISLINTYNLFTNVKTKYEHLIEGPMKGDVKSPSPFLPRLSWLSHGTRVKLCWLAASVFGGILSWTSSLLQSWFTLLPVKLFKCIFSSTEIMSWSANASDFI